MANLESIGKFHSCCTYQNRRFKRLRRLGKKCRPLSLVQFRKELNPHQTTPGISWSGYISRLLT